MQWEREKESENEKRKKRKEKKGQQTREETQCNLRLGSSSTKPPTCHWSAVLWKPLYLEGRKRTK